MSVVFFVVGSAVVAGTAAALIVHRWPTAEAPRLSEHLVAEEVERHPRLRRLLRRRLDPQAISGATLAVAGAGVLAGGLVFGGLAAMIKTGTGLAHYDLSLARYGATHHTELSTRILRDISLFGGTMGVIIAGLAVTAFEMRRHRTTAVAEFLTVVIGGQFLLQNIIKWVVDRQRPDLLHLTGFSSSSFPSGHATAAAATYMACALVLGRQRSLNTKAVLGGVAVGLAVAVAATRVFLGVHWFTDVLAGLALGWTWFAVCSIAFGGRVLRFGAPVIQAEALAEPAEVSPPR